MLYKCALEAIHFLAYVLALGSVAHSQSDALQRIAEFSVLEKYGLCALIVLAIVSGAHLAATIVKLIKHKKD